MSWRVAKSLETLRAEINAIAPRRNTAADGGIGDAAHAASASDHNPNAQGIVCARDFTHDPANGADMHAISEHIRLRAAAGLLPAVKYVIFAGRIFSATNQPFQWRKYNGSNGHYSHMHVSVGNGPDGRSTGPYIDDSRSWGLTAPTPATEPAPQPKDDTMKILHPSNAPGYEGGLWLLAGDSLIGIPNPDVLKGLVDAGIPATGIDAAAWYFLLNSTNRAGRVLVRAEGDGTVWLTDFVSKRHVTSPEDLTAVLAQDARTPFLSSRDLQVVPPVVVESIPTLSTGQPAAGTASITDADVKRIARETASEFAKRLEA